MQRSYAATTSRAATPGCRSAAACAYDWALSDSVWTSVPSRSKMTAVITTASGEQARQPGDAIRRMLGVHAEHSAPGIEQCLPVAQRRRHFEHAECDVRGVGVRRVGDREVGGGWGGDDLNEDTVAGIAFMQLASRVEEAGAV